MFHKLRRTAAPLSAALLLSLTACGGGQATTPTATVAPTVAATVAATTAPTVAATTAITATAAITSTTAITTTSSAQLPPIVIGTLATYKHTSGVFQIDVPQNWTLQDQSKADELTLSWFDPDGNAGLIVDIFESTKTNTPDDLSTAVTGFIKKTFSSKPDFFIDKPTPQTDGSVLLAWGFTASASNGVKAKLLGNTFTEQRGNKISILTTLVPADQFDSLKDQTNKIINTYKISPDVALSAASTTAPQATAATTKTQSLVIGDLATYKDKSGAFQIDVPQNWPIQDASKPDAPSLAWIDPTSTGGVTVAISTTTATNTPDDLTGILKAYLEKTFTGATDFTSNTPKPQTDGSVQIAWGVSSTDANGAKLKLLGSSFIEQRGNKISILNSFVPADQFDSLKDKLNQILNSYKITPTP
jgi:hypothetical protein